MADANPFRIEGYQPPPVAAGEASLLSNVDLSSEFYTDAVPGGASSSSSAGAMSTGALSAPHASSFSGAAPLQPPAASGAAADSRTARLCAFLSVEYYRPYFDVDTGTVLQRLKSAVTPWNQDLFASTPESGPDMYGPFWVAVSLVFFIAGESNLNAYLAQQTGKWERDFTLLSLAATMVLVYAFVVPAVWWGVAR
jgi:hypothetical protein